MVRKTLKYDHMTVEVPNADIMVSDVIYVKIRQLLTFP
jgi:hypothetical protein